MVGEAGGLAVGESDVAGGVVARDDFEEEFELFELLLKEEIKNINTIMTKTNNKKVTKLNLFRFE